MKEVNIHYFVPENARELESLIGKSVGVKMSSASPVEPMPFGGVVVNGNSPIEYEFLKQAIDNREGADIPLRDIRRLMQYCGATFFDKDGVKISGFHIVTHKPESPGYEEKFQLLKQNNQWREPQ